MNVLVIGNGGREHTIAWKLNESPSVSKVFSCPINVGIQEFGTCFETPVEDFEAIYLLIKENNIELVAVGPEVPLSLGITDFLTEKGISVFGPSKKASQIESSKGFAKDIMTKYNVPTADYKRFTSIDGLEDYINSFTTPPVVKADGLAAGKGVIIPKTFEESLLEAKEMLENQSFGTASKEIVVEECMEGPETSIFAICDGDNFKLFLPSQDHKRAFDEDLGPNTGGMGAFTPYAKADSAMIKKIEDTIISPLLKGMKAEGAPYKGLLYAGIMITKEGPKVIEFNCRFGDPETQCVLFQYEGDLAQLFMASANNTIANSEIKNRNDSAVCIVLASGGYPGKYPTGIEISGLENCIAENVMIFHAGTKNKNNKLVTAGGRVLSVVARGKTLKEAIDRGYEFANKIEFADKMMRTDIGKKGLN